MFGVPELWRWRGALANLRIWFDWFDLYTASSSCLSTMRCLNSHTPNNALSELFSNNLHISSNVSDWAVFGGNPRLLISWLQYPASFYLYETANCMSDGKQLQLPPNHCKCATYIPLSSPHWSIPLCCVNHSPLSLKVSVSFVLKVGLYWAPETAESIHINSSTYKRYGNEESLS